MVSCLVARALLFFFFLVDHLCLRGPLLLRSHPTNGLLEDLELRANEYIDVYIPWLLFFSPQARHVSFRDV